MAQISNGESGLSARNKLNEVIDKIEGNSAIGNDIDVTGTVTMDGGSTSADFTFGDNDKAIFGAGSDLQIYHDGSNSYVADAGTGDLILRGSTGIKLQSGSGVLEYLSTNSSNGSVELKLSGATKLATTSTGIDVTGTVTADGLTVDGDAVFTTGDTIRLNTADGSDNGVLAVAGGGGNSDARGAKVRFYGNEHSSLGGVLDLAAGNVSGGHIYNFTGARLRQKIDYNGDINFYEATGTTPKLTWSASDESLSLGSGGTANPAAGLIVTDSSSSGFKAKLTSSAFNSDGNWLGLGMGYHSNYMKSAIISEAKDGNARANLHFALDSDTGSGNVGLADAKMTITYDGNVGIGTTSPATELDVQGTTTTNGLNLDAISETIADTAVDIFVYDTRKDSDGGAWRKRTQGTSWYNETLNTATRGSRKEFPAVAVIVVDNVNYTITIYDGDDPDLPMWMEFSNWSYRSTSRMIGTGDNGTYTACLAMLDGCFVVGTEGSTSSNVWDGLYVINFVSDSAKHYNVTATYGDFLGSGIVDRNATGYSATNSVDFGRIVNNEVNDVAMTVLPNAPIDAATGLPVPTIAVATDGGVSVIKDDGTVADIVYSGSPAITSVDASPKRMIFSATNGVVFASGYPTADVSSSSFSTLAGLLPDGAGYYSTTIPAVLGTVSKVAA